MIAILKRNSWLTRPICAALITVLGGGACTTMAPVATPQQFIPVAQPSRIWVTRTDNSKVMIEGPRLMGDTLVGFVAGRYEEMLLPQARSIQFRAPAPRRTATLVAGAVLLGAGIIYMLKSSGSGAAGMGSEDPLNPASLRYFYPRGRR